MTTSDKKKDMMTRIRPMAVLDSGIWQKAQGVWLSVENYTARCFLNGRELICDGKHFLDLNGYGPADIAGEIVRKNISTLPKRPQKKMLAPEPPRAYQPSSDGIAIYRNYRVVRRDGQLHALPYPEPAMIEELQPGPPQAISYQIVADAPHIPLQVMEPPESPAGNNE
jgi:hypothetical protein